MVMMGVGCDGYDDRCGGVMVEMGMMVIMGVIGVMVIIGVMMMMMMMASSAL